MYKFSILFFIFGTLGAYFLSYETKLERRISSQTDPYDSYNSFASGGEGLSDSAKRGREIWYKATAGNERFHMYVVPQRLGVGIDWYRVLFSSGRQSRFDRWGLINDPDCCTPGTPNCDSKGLTLKDTYGFDYCPGDEDFITFVGKKDKEYKDPACDYEKLDEKDEDPCLLKFGASTGAMGFRKFPNPRFNKEEWEKHSDPGSWYLPKWEEAGKDETKWKKRVERIQDASLEPPYLIGISCGSCHITFNPENPPVDPNKPEWGNIHGGFGNQYIRMSELLGSAMHEESLEWQAFTQGRPGTVDTSAFSYDNVNNPNTINPIINIAARPNFFHQVKKWKKVDSCPAQNDPNCICPKDNNYHCWQKNSEPKEEKVFQILKGGEDSVGPAEAVQRVYVNIGTCSEKCWVNHLSDLKVFDPHQRGYEQTPFSIGQCLQDCGEFRAVTDRLGEILAFFLEGPRPSELHRAMNFDLRSDLENHIEKNYSQLLTKYNSEKKIVHLTKVKQAGGSVIELGRKVYAKNCASCHSTKNNVDEYTDFHELASENKFPEVESLFNKGINDVRHDWLGDDRRTGVDSVGTYACRALHRNHEEGQVWQEYGSETLRNSEDVKVDIDENTQKLVSGGRGYYRNPSLLSIWAQAPFLHNNALGPEICGQSEYKVDQKSPFIKGLTEAPNCQLFDPSTEGRLKLYFASMDDILSEESERKPKITMTYEDIIFPVGPQFDYSLFGLERKRGLKFKFSHKIGVSRLGSFRFKDFFQDLLSFMELKKENKIKEMLASKYKLSIDESTQLYGLLAETVKKVGVALGVGEMVIVDPEPFEKYMAFYSYCTDIVENKGHEFGFDLEEEEKEALKLFMLTL